VKTLSGGGTEERVIWRGYLAGLSTRSLMGGTTRVVMAKRPSADTDRPRPDGPCVIERVAGDANRRARGAIGDEQLIQAGGAPREDNPRSVARPGGRRSVRVEGLGPFGGFLSGAVVHPSCRRPLRSLMNAT
jgi:hypothetical protein